MRKLSTAAGFSLVEVTLALGIAAFCLLAVFGLMPIGVQTNRNATSQTAATNIMAAVIADLRATPTFSTTSTQFGINIPTDPTTGVDSSCQRCASCWNSQTQTLYLDTAGQVTTFANGRYRVTFTHVKNSAATPTAGAIFVDLNVTWPAPADPCATKPSGSVETMAAFDRN
jgi:uncharacterized protein (TIGR02598 family)